MLKPRSYSHGLSLDAWDFRFTHKFALGSGPPNCAVALGVKLGQIKSLYGTTTSKLRSNSQGSLLLAFGRCVNDAVADNDSPRVADAVA